MDTKISRSMFLLFFFFIYTSSKVTLALHITKVKVPTPIAVNEGGTLECEWSDDGDNIYALKWYLGLDEFYRWTPAESPPSKTFAVRGNPLTVDKQRSHMGSVHIKNVTLDAAGVFRCEVSAEAPSFHTESDVATMTVVDFPDESPRISGVQTSYQMHEEVHLNCTAINSLPAAKLAFYINDLQVDPNWLIHYKTKVDRHTGLETSVLGMRFILQNKNLKRGVARVRCTASILSVYWDSSDVFIQGDVPYQASVMEGLAGRGSVRSSSPCSILSVTASSFLLLLLRQY